MSMFKLNVERWALNSTFRNLTSAFMLKFFVCNFIHETYFHLQGLSGVPTLKPYQTRRLKQKTCVLLRHIAIRRMARHDAEVARSTNRQDTHLKMAMLWYSLSFIQLILLTKCKSFTTYLFAFLTSKDLV